MSTLPPSAMAPPSSSKLYRIFHATDIHFYVRPTWREVITEPKRLIGLFNMQVLGRQSRFSRQVQHQLVQEVQRHQPSQSRAVHPPAASPPPSTASAALLLCTLSLSCAAVCALSAAHVVLTGDLTSFATDAEFRVAHSSLLPILGRRWSQQQKAGEEEAEEEAEAAESPPPVRHQTVVLRGNHDVYTPSAVRRRLFERWFGGWQPPTGALLPLDGSRLQVLAMDPCQPNRISSHGHFDQQQVRLPIAAQPLPLPHLRCA